jgi:hypothetical protein
MTRGYAPQRTAATRARPTGQATTRAAQAVHPFACWLVRAEAAAQEVGTMSEIAVAAQQPPRAVRPHAYEPMPPALYVYRQRTPHGEHTGIVCDITPEAFLDGRVRGHESVQPDRVDGLAQYLATVPQRVELVSTLHPAGPVLRATLARAPELPPARDLAAPDGSRHTVWRIPQGPHTDELCRELGAATHYIADGHHRVAASLEVRTRSRAYSSRGVLCVAYPLDGLQLASFGRRVAGPVDSTLVRDLLEEASTSARHRRAGSDHLGHRDPPRSPLAHRLPLGKRPPGSPGMDIVAPRPRARPAAAGTDIQQTRDSTRVASAACDADGGVLFALPTPNLETLTAIADAGQVIPAKSTFFSPKPGSGIFLRDPAA